MRGFNASTMRRIAVFALPFVAMVAFFAATSSNRNITDTDLNSFQTKEFVLHGDMDVSRYPIAHRAFAFESKGSLYSVYGVGISVVSAPVYAVLARTDVSDRVLQQAAVIPFVAASILVMWRVLSRLVSKELAIAGAIVFGFGTPMWPLASMAFYQHASVAFLVGIGLLGLFSRHPRAPALAGLGFGLAAFVRAPAAVPLIVVGIFYLFQGKRQVVLYVIGALAPVSGIVIQNRWLWGTWLTGGYSVAGIGFQGDVRRGLWGLLFGWWRGLLVYSPALGLGLLGWGAALRKPMGFVERRMVALGASSIISILFYARWSTWHGGLNQFGYRYLLDIVPFLVVLGVWFVARVPRIRPVALATAALSLLTMAFGAAPNDFGWDGTYFATALEDTSLGQAWIVFANQPLGSVLRLAGVAFIGWMIYTLGKDLSTTSLEPPAAPSG
jgi:hypothetical protein